VLLSTWAADKPWANADWRIGARNAWHVRYAFEQGHRYLLFARDGM